MRPSSRGSSPGTEGPDGLHGIAPGASILPVRVGGWQPNSEGGYSVYSRTDQILAGLEAAVDPNDDGDVLDAARIALIGMVEPYAAFVDGPLPRAIAGAADLDMLAIVPAGNDGSAGPGYGSIAGPGRCAGRSDSRRRRRTPCRADRPRPRSRRPAGALRRRRPARRSADGHGDSRRRARRSTDGGTGTSRSLLRGRGELPSPAAAVLLPRAALSDDTVEEATSAGALSVLVDGPLPAGAFSLDVPAGVPVVGLADGVVAEIRAMLAAGVPVTVAIGNVEVASRVAGGSIAAFSSRGLVLDGALKPDLAAPGVSVPTSEPGRGDDGEVRFGTISGTSAAAAVTAGVAAVLAQGRPALDARALHELLVGSAQRADLDPTASGAGLVDLRAAVQQELARRAVAAVVRCDRGSGSERSASSRSRTSRRGDSNVSVGSAAIAPKGVEITVDPQRVRVRPGRTATVVVRADTADLSAEAGAATGELVLRVGDSPEVHVPWTVAVPAAVDLVSRVALDDDGDAHLGRDSRRALVRRRVGDRVARPAGARRRAPRGRAVARRDAGRAPRTSTRAAARPLHVRAHRTRADGRASRRAGATRSACSRTPETGRGRQADTIEYRVR